VVRGTPRGFTLIEVMIVLAVIAVLAAVIIPNYVRSRGLGQASACKSNLRNLASAIESYMLDNAGRVPQVLADLPPLHINVIPTCPGGAANTCSGGYESSQNPAAYTIACQGSNHAGAGIPPNLPQFASSQGLVGP